MIFDQAVDRIRALARRRGPVLASVEGRPGLSPLPFVLQATEGARRLVFEPPALSDRANMEAFAARLRPFAADAGHAPAAPRRGRTSARDLPAWRPWAASPGSPGSGQDWPSVLSLLLRSAPLTLVVNEPKGLAAANRRFWRMLGETWIAVRRRSQRVHIVLASEEHGLGRQLNASGSPFRDPGAGLGPRPAPAPADVVQVAPGSHYDLAAAFPEWRGRDLLLGWAVFGGLPSTWLAMRSAACLAGAPPGDLPGPAETLRACLSRADGPLASAPRDHLERRVQKTRRYASILSAVARGARSWGQVSDALGPGSPRGATGPYLKRLRDLGLVVAERPLGAPRSGRRTRYRLADPFDAFWWAALHPARSEVLSSVGGASPWRGGTEPALGQALDAALPQVCRNFLRFGCEPALGAVARQAGPLWGEGCDFPAAATLENGAVCYAHVHAGPGPADLSELKTLEAQMRRTRYGRGRQARIRLLVSTSGFTEALRREAARGRYVRLAGAEDLAAAPGPCRS